MVVLLSFVNRSQVTRWSGILKAIHFGQLNVSLRLLSPCSLLLLVISVFNLEIVINFIINVLDL